MDKLVFRLHRAEKSRVDAGEGGASWRRGGGGGGVKEAGRSKTKRKGRWKTQRGRRQKRRFFRRCSFALLAIHSRE